MSIDVSARALGPRVITQSRSAYLIEDGSGARPAKVSGKMLHTASSASDLPVVGDRVDVKPGSGEPAVIVAVQPRKSLLLRKAPGPGIVDQPLAANVDLVFVVIGLDREVNARAIHRYTTMAWSGGAIPIIVLTKADLVGDPLDTLERIERECPGIDVFAVDALAGDVSFSQRWLLSGTTIALVGASGAGKTTLLNRLARQSFATGAVRSDGKGRHTTVSRHLIELPSGTAIIDTPGLRELGLWGDEDSADQSFEDIVALASSCRFADCSHEHEPGCSVLAALLSGSLTADRLSSYRKLKRELRALELKKDVHAAREEKRRIKRLNAEGRARARHL